MKKIILLLITLNLFVYTNSQDGYVTTGSNLMYKSSDSLNGKPKNMFIFGGFVKLNVIYDFVGLTNITALNIPKTPIGKQSKTPKHSF